MYIFLNPLFITHQTLPLRVPALSIPPHTEKPTRPLQVYFRHTRSTTTTPTDPPGLPPAAAPGTPSATLANDILIALRKALWHPPWKMAMDEEMSTLISRGICGRLF
ncbi:UNVERIFIED_CONTAM: hypothetical protein Sangu_2711100 [Sesamum angustifolium]|uniref:Uncharacterized protein n=1 Tax=Sesamum angustifolium TaxID=2727405 RepID=A0AAW2IXT0_9LAMI